MDKNTIDISRFLTIGIAICRSVHGLHIRDLRCHYLTPTTILINTNEEIKIIETEKSEDIANKVYRAPEQILKNSRHINHLTDIYVLGIIFYQMLLDELPFVYSDLLEYSHTIITQEIPFLTNKKKSIPSVIALIIEKVTSINQVERYKDILSVIVDLMKALRAIDENSHIKTFKIDTFKTILDLHTDDKMYGRENEVNRFQHMIDSKSSMSNSLVLVYGHSGVGKPLLCIK